MLGTLKARERRFHHGFACPRCQNTEVQRWGHERSGTQRYRCLCCRRTFNDLTNTAMAGTHLVAQWYGYADAMRNRLSTRDAALAIGVDHKTVWRWRHKVMKRLTDAGSPPDAQWHRRSGRDLLPAQLHGIHTRESASPAARHEERKPTRTRQGQGAGTRSSRAIRGDAVRCSAGHGDRQRSLHRPSGDRYLGWDDAVHRRLRGATSGGAAPIAEARGPGHLTERTQARHLPCADGQ